MSRKRKVYAAEFKSKVALAAVREGATVQQVGARFSVSPQQVSKWKAKLVAESAMLFEDGRVKKKEPETDEAALYEEIGRLKMEVGWLKKKLPGASKERRGLVDVTDTDFTVSRQCELLDIPRSTFYYSPQVVATEELTLMIMIDWLHMQWPTLGCRKLGAMLGIDKDRANRLMRKMGIEVIYPKPRLSRICRNHDKYPYLLRGLKIDRPNHVWATDITYLPMAQGFMYLTAVMDWYSRYVISWRLSNTLDKRFCIEALEEALATGVKPEIFNTDQGSQFTSDEFTGVLKKHAIQISMDGSGRWIDNVLVERLWRTIKYDEIYLNAYESVGELESRLTDYFAFYNHARPHQSLGQVPPSWIYAGQASRPIFATTIPMEFATIFSTPPHEEVY